MQVTHDTSLAVLVAELEGRDAIDEEHWPWMMEGLWVWFENARMHWVWRGHHGHRELALA